MEQREQPADSHVEGSDRRLRDLASKWFIDTQVPLIVHNGLFPAWFLGFISRKDAEEILREKELGCFLIRLSDKAIGYILSYKGRDRCRHFVINQSKSGKFVVCGDTEGHDMVSDLIEYYKTTPIQPFEECLTYPCFETLNEELYDTIQISPREEPVASNARGMRNVQKQMNPAPEQLPTRPPKGNKTGGEEVPPLPRRSRHVDSVHLNDQDKLLYAQLRKHSPREIPRFQHTCQDSLPGDIPARPERSFTLDQNIRRCSPPAGPDSVYSELGLLESRSNSLPPLENRPDGDMYYRLSVPPSTPPRLSPKPARQGASYSPTPDKMDSFGRQSHSLEHMEDNAVYFLAGRPINPRTTTSSDTRSEQHSDSVYAEVPGEATAGHFPNDGTYELIPGHEDTAQPKPKGNTYEPLEDIRPKHNHSSWGLKNDKWKWLFPEVKRKW